jgi:hypothetical protein
MREKFLRLLMSRLDTRHSQHQLKPIDWVCKTSAPRRCTSPRCTGHHYCPNKPDCAHYLGAATPTASAYAPPVPHSGILATPPARSRAHINPSPVARLPPCAAAAALSRRLGRRPSSCTGRCCSEPERAPSRPVTPRHAPARPGACTRPLSRRRRRGTAAPASTAGWPSPAGRPRRRPARQPPAGACAPAAPGSCPRPCRGW